VFDLSVGDYVWARRLVGGQRNEWIVVGFCETAGGSFVPSLRGSVGQISELYASDGSPQALDVDADGVMTVLTELITPTLQLQDTGADNTLALTYNEDATADRVFNLVMGDADRTLTLSDDVTLGDWFDQSVKAAASPTFAYLKFTPGSAPGSPAEGDVYVNSSDHNIYFYNGSDWEDLAGAGGGGVTGSGTATYIPAWTGSTSLGDSIIVDDGSDHVGIGTASPGGILELMDGSVRIVFTSNRIERWDDDSDAVQMWVNYEGYAGGTTRFRDFVVGDGKHNGILAVDGSAGGVGIGTLAPTDDLEVVDAGTDARSRIDLTTYNDQAAYSPVMWMRKSNSDTPGTVSETQDGDVLGELGALGVSSGSAFVSGSYIRWTQNGSAGASRVPVDMHFLTSPGGTTAPLDRMVITYDGAVHLVPVGTPASPTEGDLYSDADHNLYYYNGTGWDDLTAGGGTGLWTDQGTYVYANNYTSVVVTDTGRLGVGTTNPLGKIDATQSSASGVIPSLYLYQADVDQPLIMFRGQATTGLGNNIIAEVEVTTATRAGWLRVEVQDDGSQITSQDYFIPIYTLA